MHLTDQRNPGAAAGNVATTEESVTIGVVAICGATHLARCLDALAAQVDPPPFDVVVVYDPHLDDIPQLAARYPAVRMVANAGQRSPLELAARAVAEATGDRVFLTEDHCIPQPDWARKLYDAQASGRAAVGGLVETADGTNSVDWAFYAVDFFRYMAPAVRGPSPSLTVCNVAYRRDQLRSIETMWSEIFHETAINEALRERFGDLWLAPDAQVHMRRNVRFGDAVYERYAFGRLFGCTRLQFAPGRRLYYSVFAPALPLLLLGRIAGRSFRSGRNATRFVRALPVLVALVFAWAWGEWLGYLTRKRPRSLVVAPEIRARQRKDTP
jgi:hypothetical protein